MKKLILQLLCSVLLLTASSRADLFGQTGTIPFFTVLSPSSVTGIYEEGQGFFTSSAANGWGGDLSNDVLIAPLGIVDAGADTLLCDTLSATDFTGKIAIIQRGACEFGRKCLTAQQLGAVGIIIINNAEIPIGMGEGSVGAQVTIPAIMVRQSLGLSLLQLVRNGEEVIVSMGQSPSGYTLLEGDILIDANDNCVADAGELPAQGFKIGIETGNGVYHLRLANSAGHYKIYVDPTQSPFVLTPFSINQGWTVCPSNITVSSNTPDTIQNNFTVNSFYDCTQLEASISAPFLRRCFSNPVRVEVCNQGTITAENAYAVVTLDPEFGPITSATLPFTIISPDVYQFDLGDIDPFACVDVILNTVVSCDSTVIGQTLCYSVHAYPDTSCIQPSQAWNGANVVVNAVCDGSTVEFVITNESAAAMAEPSEYIVIQDDVMYMIAPFQLGGGESEIISLPADGSTWRVEAGQVANHPISINPSEAIEGCTVTGNFSTGFLLMLPLDDEGLAVDEECQELVGSFDPNDKLGMPLGFTDARLIRPEVDIDYRIRFQNTGTDTAFTVVIRDTLTQALDPRSIREVVASHPYSMEISNDSVLVFRFNNILLVDSFTNEPASHGYVIFKISQQPNNPFGTSIDNRAGIYFDFNPPVMTNTTHHEVGEVVSLPVAVKEIKDAHLPVLYPNPVSANTVLEIQGADFVNATYSIIDMQGRTQRTGAVSSLQIPLNGIHNGLYIIKITAENGRQYAVKVLVR